MILHFLKKKNKIVFDPKNPQFTAFNSQYELNGFKKYATDNNTCRISSIDGKINVTISDDNALEAFKKCCIAIESLLIDEYNNNNEMNLNKFINSNLWRISIFQTI